MKKERGIVLVSLCILLLSVLVSCAPAATAEISTPPQETIITSIADAEKLAGFDVKEPTYLPKGVSLASASYQSTPNPIVILQFKLNHETYGEMGNFFQVVQELQGEPPADVLSCGENPDGCEILQINNVPVVYRQNQGGTEGLDWYADGFVFRLLRTAGEPNKVYKDELIKVVESMLK